MFTTQLTLLFESIFHQNHCCSRSPYKIKFTQFSCPKSHQSCFQLIFLSWYPRLEFFTHLHKIYNRQEFLQIPCQILSVHYVDEPGIGCICVTYFLFARLFCFVFCSFHHLFAGTFFLLGPHWK